MRQLLILRHAKAVAEDEGPDRERRLNARGQAQALAQGAFLKAHDLIPSRILCSPALRTRQTLEKLGEAWGQLPETELVGELYAFGDGEPYLDAIAEHGAAAGRLMVLGHNPSVHALALRLAGAGSDAAALAGLRGHYPTCTLSLLEFSLDAWADIREESGRLRLFKPPA